MSIDIKVMVVIFIYAIVSNLFLYSISNDTSLDMGCPQSHISGEQNSTYSIQNYTLESTTDTKEGLKNYLDMVSGRCTGIPFWAYWITQVPVLLSVIVFIRQMIGFT